MAKRTGLGRGIGALIPTQDSTEARPVDVFFPGASLPAADADGSNQDAAPAETPAGEDELVAVPGTRLIEVDPNEIVPNPRQPRTNFDADDLAELVHSVREFGVLQPVVVRRNEDGAYELIMGERRTRAAREAGLTAIPAVLRETEDEHLLRDALLENLHRSQLNPLEEASAYQQLLEDFGITQEELAGRIGRSRPQISNTIRLLKLPVAVQQRVAAGVLSAGHARAILSLDDAEAISRELGTYTVRQKSISRPMFGGTHKGGSVSISDQPRRLLLPQEVKELGTTRMILFYEGLRPVLAHRIRYFEDKSFAKRELPPPAVPKLDVLAANRAGATTTGSVPSRPASPPPRPNHADGTPATAAAPRPASPSGGSTITKEVSAVSAAVLNDELKLSDFSFDFDDVEIPTEPLTDDEIKQRADAFVSRLLD